MRRGPIFLGGLSGSGKTLLRLLLSRHPNLALTRRTYLWTRFYGRYGDLGRRANFERCLGAILAQRHARVLNPDPDRIRREFWNGEPTYARLFGLLHEQYAEQIGKPRWGDQLGLVERYADPIFAAFPAARMLQMVRDPRDHYAASLARSTRRTGKVGIATARWLHSAEWARRNERRYPGRYKVVRYEALLLDREATLREVCAFLEEELVPEMLELDGALKLVEQEDDEPEDGLELGGSGGGLEADGRAAISKRETTFIQAHAGRQMADRGYEPAAVPLSLGDRLLFATVDWPINTAGMVAWQLRSRWSAR